MMISGKQESGVSVIQYDEKIKRKSLEDPLRHHRRSSIPFVDRKPAVRFIRSIEQRKASVVGPKAPLENDSSHKPILKKSIFPNPATKPGEAGPEGGARTTNDELENCKNQADLIMDKISRAERIARGSIDVLTFPASTPRVGALSKYQGNMTISVCTIDILTTSTEFQEENKKDNHVESELQMIVNLAYKTVDQASAFQSTAKKFLGKAKHRYNEWEKLMKKNTDFKIEHSKLSYPIYAHRRMPESVTLFDDDEGADIQALFDGCVRICCKHPEKIISLHCDSVDQMDLYDPVDFHKSSLETQTEVIKFIISHGADLLVCSDNCLSQGLEVLLDHEMDEAFEVIRNKITGLEYDDCFDPLCALELKNALGELVARKAELLNTAEQIVQHCQHITTVAKMFYRYTKRSVKGGVNECISCLGGGGSKNKLLHLLEMVSSDDISILLPLTIAMAQDIFHMEPFTSGKDNEDSTDVV